MIIDRLTGVAEARAFKNVRSRKIIVGIEHWVKSRGCPWVLCTNVAQATRSHDLRTWCNGRDILQEFSLPYHHASIGFVEHFNQMLLN